MKTFIASGMVLLAVNMVAAFAPAPQPRPVPPLEVRIQGEWTLEWGTLPGKAMLARDGTWACQWAGQNYAGSWSVSGSRLTLKEHRVSDHDEPYHPYQIDLDEPVRGQPGVTGKIDRGARFTLRR